MTYYHFKVMILSFDGMNELFLAGYEMGALRGAEWLLASGAVEEVPIALHGKDDQSEM